MIASVRKACQIISCFTRDEPVLGNAEISEKLGLSRSSTHHLLKTLCNEGVLIKDKGRKYRLGWKVLEWTNSVMFQQDIYDKAMPLVKDLVDQFKGTVHISMFDHGEVVNVLRITSREAIYVHTYLGSRKPAYCTSAGKVLLAYNDVYFQETIKRGLSKQGPNTITDINKLKEELRTIRKKGYSISDNENDTHTYAIAAPIKSYSGEVIASTNFVSSPSYMRMIQQQKVITSLLQTAKEISRELGYIELSKRTN